jgi:hypothetical protein
MDNKVAVEYIGPFQEYRITVNGYRVPRLTGHIIDDVLTLCLDNRFALDVPEEYAIPVVQFVANALAVGAGYSCFGENSEPVNPFNRRMYGIDVAQVDSGCENVTETPQ